MFIKRIKLLVFACVCFVSTVFANDVITLDLSQPTKPSQFTLDTEKGYWSETYNTALQYRQIVFDVFSFSHMQNAFGGEDVGGGMSYWDGFTYCTNGDITDYGELGDSGGWVAQQWGCIAGGGIKTDAEGKVMTDVTGKVLVEKGNPYLVAYWGYWMEMMGQGAPCLQTNFTDGKAYEAVGVYIANHPWPYYGNMHGDGFAQPFDKEGDFFKLIIHGLNDRGEDTGVTVEHMLSEFKDGKLNQSSEWQWVDLSALGVVSGIYYTMETSDADPIYGPNTAVYFCLDKLQVRLPNESTTPSRPSGITATSAETTIALSWNASTSSVGVKGYNVYLNGVFNAFVEETQHTLINLSAYTEYQIEVEAVATDNTLSEKAKTTVSTIDITAPSIPLNLKGTATEYAVTISWDESTDNVGVKDYPVYLNGEIQKNVKGATTYTLTGLDSSTSYFIEIEARDAAGNRSEKASLTISTSALTSIETVTHNNPIKILSDIIQIENATGGLLDIYAVNGVKVMSYKTSQGHNVIDISKLEPGIYIIKYENLVQRTIKQ